MNILIIGSNGGLGKHVTKRALDSGHNVTALVVNEELTDYRAILLRKDLFDIKSEDVLNFDVVISCFGSGFDVDPIINKNVCAHYLSVFKNMNTRIIHIIGSGSLYCDKNRTMHIYEKPDHPDFLRNISKYATEGLSLFLNNTDTNWTVVMPSLNFDNTKLGSESYEVGLDLVPIYNKNNESYITYSCFACAVLEFVEKGLYNKHAVTILEKTM